MELKEYQLEALKQVKRYLQMLAEWRKRQKKIRIWK